MNGLCAHCDRDPAPASERPTERVLLFIEMEFAFDPTGRAEVRRSGSP